MNALDFFDRYADRIMPEPNSGCWLWIGSWTGKGYGNLTAGNRSAYAHRLAYEAANGVGSASGWVVRHRCDNPCCCNPDHLLIGTHKNNSEDAWARGRITPARGEGASRALITEAVVLAARSLAKSGTPLCELARRFGVHHHTIDAAVTGRSWSHLPGAVPRSALVRARRSSLKREDVSAIKAALRMGARGADLARSYGVKPGAISAIKTGRNWADVAER